MIYNLLCFYGVKYFGGVFNLFFSGFFYFVMNIVYHIDF